ncbi:MAG: DUF6359 domain-containing protein [Prevotellaceae bacterium]|nr:DUF6359 domain-containing protein [Prevotellaceae bacterium]
MKRGHSIFTIMLFISVILSGCEKLVVPEYGGNDTEKTDSDKDNDSGTEDEKGNNGSSTTPDDNDKEDDNPGTEDNNPEDNPNKGDNGKEEDIIHNGNENSPYLASDLATGYVGKYIIEKGAAITNSWVVGYIVGYVNGTKLTEKSAAFAAGDKETNILIADTPLETDHTNCVPVQLSSNTSYMAARNALNLKKHPENIGKKVKLAGIAEKYMGRAGIKNTREYKFIE